jgi:hypothetical protein
MNQLETLPDSEICCGTPLSALQRKRKFWLRAIWLSIAGIIIPPLFGLGGTVIGMVRAFGELSQTGEADPTVLAEDISVSLVTTAWGLTISLVALFILIIALVRYFNLPRPEPAVPPANQPAPDRRGN